MGVLAKLSPLIGNLIEFNLVELLNSMTAFRAYGRWLRQDPGFPDAIFEGSVWPVPGIEVKAWFPLATEITARFKDSQATFTQQNTRVVLLAWLPEAVIFGRPRILDVRVVDAGSIALARDQHYHRPPEYLVLEPEDTRARTRNLQQTNTNGYRWQGTPEQLEEARHIVQQWGNGGVAYQPTLEYQQQLRTLLRRYPYRLDTNFAKIDRIAHPEIEAFKRQVQGTVVEGLPVQEWLRLLNRRDTPELRAVLGQRLNLSGADVDDLVK